MSMKKILNEWKKFTLNEGRFTGLYDVMIGVEPGSVDVFIKHFVGDFDVARETKEIITKKFGGLISKAVSGLPEDKRTEISNKLTRGYLIHWRRLLPNLENEIVKIKAGLYLKDLKSIVDSAGYSSLQSNEDLEKLSTKQQNAIRELHFMKENIGEFFSRFVSQGSMNNTGYLGNPGVGAAFFGQMDDWFLGNEKSNELQSAIKNIPTSEDMPKIGLDHITLNPQIKFDELPDELPEPPKDFDTQNDRLPSASDISDFFSRFGPESNK